VMVTSRVPDDELYQVLLTCEERFQSLRAIGDCHAPSTVAAAVYDGHSAARHLQSQQDIYAPLFVRDIPEIMGN
jgi:dimethylamine/trimethylamine dehydrogenase